MTEKYTITPTDTIFEALKRIDANKEGFLIVVDNDSNAVQGVITDGDTRRHIIKCGSISSVSCRFSFKPGMYCSTFAKKSK